MNIKKLINISKKPPLFERSKIAFWDDYHISSKMLEAHLDPEWDAASRKRSTIKRSVEWLSEDVFPSGDINILDLGCGPGLYTSRLAERGYSVTGIDYSQRSIAYARNYAHENSLDINYIYQDYLTIDFENEFEVVMLIFCDLGALSNKETNTLLEKIYRALKPGGIFIFDVFTDKNRAENDLGRNWEVNDNGFWSEKPYLALTETFLYPEANTFLNQTIVMTEEGKVNIYRLFNHYYTKETITEVLERFGFKNHCYHSDITGKEQSEESKTLAVVSRK